MVPTRTQILEKIDEERTRQIEKWGDQTHTAGFWLLVLQEEIGEASQAILQSRDLDAAQELVQAAAVIVAWLEDPTQLFQL